MADPHFFATAGPLALSDIARLAQAEIAGDASPDSRYDDVAPLDEAGPREVSFLDNTRYLDAFRESRAGLCIVDPKYAENAPDGMTLLLTETPYHAYAAVAEAFHPHKAAEPGVHPTAAVAASAALAEGVHVGPGAVVGDSASIGRGTEIGANAVLGDGVAVGDECRVGAHVTLSHCRIGARVVIHPGARIGQDGFGFALGKTGHRKVPQLGRVIVEDDVEIGANTTIDRGTGPDTVIGAGSKIDNLVQIAHNVRLGKGCVIVAQVGISGSTRVGDWVMMGGQAGLTGHLSIGDGAQVAAQSGVMRDVEPGEKVMGSPAQPIKTFFRGVAALERLTKKRG